MNHDGIKIHPLLLLLDLVGESKIKSLLMDFHCTRDQDREEYLHTKAIVMEKKSVSRTYLAIENDKVVGYFTIGLKCMKVPEDVSLSNTIHKRMNIDHKSGVAQSYLLGQIGRDDSSSKGLGKKLLDQSIQRVMNANRIVGCRMIRLDCTDDLTDYYEDNGFIKISKNNNSNLNQMVMLL